MKKDRVSSDGRSAFVGTPLFCNVVFSAQRVPGAWLAIPWGRQKRFSHGLGLDGFS